MESKKVLFISQEITPYLGETKLSKIGRYLPQGIQERGKEIRTFMPRYGCINERRNQLHEVIRLSGMNLIIDDTDHPLIIKVASIQSARMQVYFIDNDDYFQRKYIVSDGNGKEFEDNDERALFFARGVIETVKKLRWSPDIVHCHGWMAALVPIYLKSIYSDDPLFHDYKIVYSVYNNDFKTPLRSTFADKLRFDGIDGENLRLVKKPDFVNVTKLAIKYSDAIIIGSEQINEEIAGHLNTISKPVLPYKDESEYIDAYNDFYDELLSQK
ncbi:MAG TPA: glycogen/starch synthase [Bacteroidales bacterium]|mgnify:FL=1|nr:glycogen/starch synthase [Bacteroidales bacterium]HPJ59215.1 glycogen/starch synthase [Bacteroidales bacterium]HPR11838.1 glycogen/starch synthase [Bacteroidales bacterium]HRW84013.1 glycogen/starch synthase [Bacteroidales bacterium]